jgi:hypothetical protein
MLFARFCVVASTTSTRPSPHHLLSPERHTTFFRPKGTRLLGTPPSFGYGDNIFGGNLGVTSLRDTISSRHCTSATPLFGFRPHHLFGLRAPLGSGLDPSLPTNNLGSSIGQAFQSHLFGRHHSPRNHLVWPPGQPPPPTALLVSLSPHHLLQPQLYPTSFGRRQPRMRTRPGLLSGRALLLRSRHQKHHLYLRRLHRSSLPPTPPAAA